MLLRTIGKFVYGVIAIEISGLVPEKLINLCTAHGIYLWSIMRRDEKMYAKIYVADFFRIRSIVRKSGCRVRVVGYRGLPFLLKRLERRKMMWVGVATFIFLLNYFVSFVWFVDITGTKNVAKEKVQAVAEEYGLRPGMPKERLQAKLLEKNILMDLPELAWVGISSQGTHVTIEVVEKAVPKEEDKAPAHIVAAKDGIIVEAISLAGEAVVVRGATVKKGDILIKGILAEQEIINQPKQNEAKTPQPLSQTTKLRARGIVKARVWYEGYGEASLAETIWERTGRQTSSVIARVGDWEALLNLAPQDPFTQYEIETIQKKFPNWRNSALTVESTINIYHELESKVVTRDEMEARELARERALSAVQQKIPETAQILANDIVALKTLETDIVRVKAHVETIEDIGEPQSINP